MCLEAAAASACRVAKRNLAGAPYKQDAAAGR
jgi:hypothetical protein